MAGKRVLIIDSDNNLATEVEKSLIQMDNEALFARDESQGTMLAHREKPDLVVIGRNISAPESMKILQDFQKSVDTMLIPVIFISKVNNEVEEKEALATGAAAYIKRPFKTEDLLVEIRKFTGD
jgi:DNA-binding response OmpR family regulator